MSRRFLKFLKGTLSAPQSIHSRLTARQETYPDTQSSAIASSAVSIAPTDLCALSFSGWYRGLSYRKGKSGSPHDRIAL